MVCRFSRYLPPWVFLLKPRQKLILPFVIFSTFTIYIFLSHMRHGARRIQYHYPSSDGENDSLPFHPFENECKIPLHSTYAQDIEGREYTERLRTLKCNVTAFPMATLDGEGYLYVHPHYVHNPKEYLKNVVCNIYIIEGGLRDKVTNEGKNDFKEVAEIKAHFNRRLDVNADAFYVRCFNNNSELIWEKPFAGMRDLSREKNTVSIIPETPSVDQYGRKILITEKKDSTNEAKPLSIDILGFDSTSRTNFHRQMPRSWETMERLGYEVLYGYNKVGDNSAVNLAPILVGDIPEAFNHDKFDDSGDINKHWILPTEDKLDPSNLKFLWKLMKEKYGCQSMFNEDISVKSLGLFNYPSSEFMPGFHENPADHYYRAYYLAVYKNWTYSPCYNGDQIQKEFLNLWHRFATKHKDICHFGFTFITTLTHETPIFLSLLDETLASHLETQHSLGSLDKSVSIIMGDHGNRIGAIKYTYTGRFEERLPLMAIRFPESFKRDHPEEYTNFRANRFKLTNNFDVHQMLKDIVLNDTQNRADVGRGISLFKTIPASSSQATVYPLCQPSKLPKHGKETSAIRVHHEAAKKIRKRKNAQRNRQWLKRPSGTIYKTCRDAYIAENFCTCLIDRSNVTEPIKGTAMKDKDHLQEKFYEAMKLWISEKKIDECISPTAPPYGDCTTIGQNPFVRHGLRSKENVTQNEIAVKNIPKMDYLFHDIFINVTSSSHPTPLTLIWRFSNYITTDDIQVNFEPLVQTPPGNCRFKSIIDVCSCLMRSK